MFKEYKETIFRESKLDLGLVVKLEDIIKNAVRIFYRGLDLIFDAKAIAYYTLGGTQGIS